MREEIMKMKGYLKRGLCLGMAAVLAFSFTGCGKEKKQDNELLAEASTISKDHVFSVNEVEIPGLPADLNRLGIYGDRIYASSYRSEEYIEVYTFNSDGSDLKTVKFPTSTNTYYMSLSLDIYKVYL